MLNPFSEFWPFLTSFVVHLNTVITGCAITFAVAFLEKYTFKQPNPWKWELAVVFCFFFFACFQTWRDQYDNVLTAKQEQAKTQRQFEELEEPKFELICPPAIIGETSETQEGHSYPLCFLYLQVSVLNHGAPSVIRDCKAFLRLKDGTQLEGHLWEPAAMHLTVTTTNGPRTLTTAPSLLETWETTAIPKGGRGVGCLLFKFPSGTSENFMGPRGEVILRLWDRTGKDYKIEMPWNPTSLEEVETLPGMGQAH